VNEQVDENKSYLQSGGMAEVYFMAEAAAQAGAERVQIDPHQLMALCEMAGVIMPNDAADPEEVLARMWMMCDPNRQPAEPDEIITMHNPEREVPHWHWFIPRAQASAKFLGQSGYKLVKIDG
jgi:hypothetical protein